MVGEHIQYYFSSFKFVEVCFMVFLSSFVSLLIFFLVLSVVEGEELPTRIVDLNFFFFSSVSFCFPYFAALLFGVYTFRIASLLGGLNLLSLYKVLFCLWYFTLLWSLLYLIFLEPGLLSFSQYLHGLSCPSFCFIPIFVISVLSSVDCLFFHAVWDLPGSSYHEQFFNWNLYSFVFCSKTLSSLFTGFFWHSPGSGGEVLPDHWEVEVEVHVLYSAFVATRRWVKKALSLLGRVGVPVR